MRVVLDTNVLVSGVFFKGAPFEILQAWHRDRFQLCISPEIILEYEAVLQRLRDQFPGVDALDILAVVVSNADVVDAPPLEEVVSADPDDDKFIACAVAAGAHFLVSGDRDLLDVAAYGGTRIVSQERSSMRGSSLGALVHHLAERRVDLGAPATQGARPWPSARPPA